MGKKLVKKKAKKKPAKHSRIRSALRKVWLYSEERQQALLAARQGRNLYKCAICCHVVDRKSVDVDHVKTVGSTPGSKKATEKDTWDTFIKRLFCPANELQILCKDCHSEKTYYKATF